MMPWLVWLSGLSAILQTERSLVQFPVRARAWVVGQVPSWGGVRGNQFMYLSCMCLSLSFSPLPLSVNKNLKEKKKTTKLRVRAQRIQLDLKLDFLGSSSALLALRQAAL